MAEVRKWLYENGYLFIDQWLEDEDPERLITREEAAVILVSIAMYGDSPLIGSQLSTLSSELSCKDGSPFIDVSPDRWSCGYIKKMYELEK